MRKPSMTKAAVSPENWNSDPLLISVAYFRFVGRLKKKYLGLTQRMAM
jgi:hypothetical protein